MSRLTAKIEAVNVAVNGYLDAAKTAVSSDRVDVAVDCTSKALDLLRRLAEVDRVAGEAEQVKISADAAVVAPASDVITQ